MVQIRVNVYEEELTTDVRAVSKRAGDGKEYIGLRFVLESSDRLGGDDRSAVTFWIGDRENGRRLANAMLAALDRL